MLNRQVVFPIASQPLVQVGILLMSDSRCRPQPHRLVFVDQLPGPGHGHNLLLRARLRLLLAVLHVQADWEAHKGRVLQDQVLEPGAFEKLVLITLEVADDFRPALHHPMLEGLVFPDNKGAAGTGFPYVLLVVEALRDNPDLLGDKVGAVEADPELADHGHVRSRGHGLHESFGAGLGDGAQVGHELVASHADARILDCDRPLIPVGRNIDVELWLYCQLLRARSGLVLNLVHRIGGIRDQLAEEDLFVGVEGVDDEAHQLGDVSIEGIGLCLLCRHVQPGQTRYRKKSRRGVGG
mmetsp:Transcript_68534/g.149130  ORF Transcript_68534/g.149130 Transcript_68534/m.149130 type:complete len:296 (+) Transcript_68534:2199-3086(+)